MIFINFYEKLAELLSGAEKIEDQEEKALFDDKLLKDPLRKSTQNIAEFDLKEITSESLGLKENERLSKCVSETYDFLIYLIARYQQIS